MVADWSCGSMHIKSRELESNRVCNKPICKEALPAKILNLTLSLFDLFHFSKILFGPCRKKKRKKSSSVVLRRYLGNTQEHMQWAGADWDKYLLQQTPTSWTEMIHGGKSKVKIIVEDDNRFQCVISSAKEFGDYLFCHIEEIKIHVPQ